MSYLYKRSNWLWHRLIQQDLVHRVWSPLVHLTRLRHLSFRAQLAKRDTLSGYGNIISAGV